MPNTKFTEIAYSHMNDLHESGLFSFKVHRKGTVMILLGLGDALPVLYLQQNKLHFALWFWMLFVLVMSSSTPCIIETGLYELETI